MKCPACHHQLEAKAWVCSSCDKVVDATSFETEDVASLDVEDGGHVPTFLNPEFIEEVTDDLEAITSAQQAHLHQPAPMNGPAAGLPAPRAPTPQPSSPSANAVRQRLASAVRAAPIQERRRTSDLDRVAPSRPESDPRGAKLFEQALAAKAEGNMAAARNNLKLALTFDPENQEYHEALRAVLP